MKLVALNCLSCGANIDINSDKRLAFCPYCGAKMLIDDEIQKIELSGKVEVSGIPTLDRLCTNAETFIGIGDYRNADRTILEIYKNYPSDYRGYFLALLSRIRSKPHYDYSVSNNPKYNVSGFYSSIPLMTDICNLANQALHFAPTEKHPEIKDLASYWLKPIKGISEDARGKVQEFNRLEDICKRQEDEIRQKISAANDDISIMETKQKRQWLFFGLSIVAFFLGVYLVTVHPTFTLFLLAAFISAVVFLIKHLITKSKLAISKRKVEKAYLVLGEVKSKNGHSEWPDDQGTPENTSNALDTFFASLNRFSEL
jgi:hypothetical protein